MKGENCLSQSCKETTIRNYQNGDLPLLGQLYRSVKTNENAIFWWIGDEDSWGNVYCAFEDGKMIAKGQVSIISIVSPDRPKESTHSIFLNLKTIPERENDFDLLDKVYQHLHTRAKQLKATLPREHKTMLCVGNDSSEIVNNQFFIQKGYRYQNSLFGMNRDLTKSISEIDLQGELEFSYWKMETADEESDYLKVEGEIWPDHPLGASRIAEYKQYPIWTSMVVRHSDTIVGGLMAWEEEGHGVIEDVFVREQWRKRGIAKYLLTQGLKYLKSHQLQNAKLEVHTTNSSALSLYESVGFYIAREELRYFIDLD